jgi:hypothetical protein
MGQVLVASARMQAERRGEDESGTRELGGELAGATGVGAGTVFGAGGGLRPQPHGTMDLIMEPAFNHSGPATDGCGSTYVNSFAHLIVEIDTGRGSASGTSRFATSSETALSFDDE